MIAVDFIVKLPVSKGYDSICIITDHDCTKAVILLPCQEEMSSLDVARLYLERVFPFVGLPDKVISDRDSKFTSKVFREVCELLEVKQKMASTYHPQTNGQSEKTNQHVETALRIFGNFRQNDWSNLLPVVQYQINSRVSNATKQTPYETWMGFIPWSHQPLQGSPVPKLEEHKSQLREAWQLAAKVMIHAQSLWKSSACFQPYKKGDKVWLKGTNLHMSHPTHKLCPKRFGPFEIMEVLSPITYQLALPPAWCLHNTFHATLLSPYQETLAHGANYLALTSELIDGEPKWEVEKILASRRCRCKQELQYLVKWVRYPESDNTWESAENLRVLRLVKEFHKCYPKATRDIKAARFRRSESVKMRLRRGPCVTRTQGDCRGGNKTVFNVLKRL